MISFLLFLIFQSVSFATTLPLTPSGKISALASQSNTFDCTVVARFLGETNESQSIGKPRVFWLFEKSAITDSIGSKCPQTIRFRVLIAGGTFGDNSYQYISGIQPPPSDLDLEFNLIAGDPKFLGANSWVFLNPFETFRNAK